nr:glycosyltransferase family A protein [uncultured Flavobacterium sp.]
MPKVSIIVPCYNQAQYLDEALQSVLDQTYEHWECIIVNDGSPDHTEEIANKWIAKDSRFLYLYKVNGGLSSARNAGIAMAKGGFILPLDADDRISNQYVVLALNAFERDNSLKVVYCKAEKFGNESGIWDLPLFSMKGIATQNMIFCSSMYRKSEWERVGGYDMNMINGFEDWEFWIALLKNGGNVKCVDCIGFYYRMKPNSMIQVLDKEKKKKLHEYMSIKHADFFVEQLGSFMHLNLEAERAKTKWHYKLKKKKFVVDVFCATFLGFTIFKTYKKH